ncbi:hypothetical protein SLEP1_g3373 [Rubroshorea leprosula]|uniref:Uncharacterized protein n=1 Tax=Rubroshorea leprosula TaxID=152421 RepID=A0AAV5HTY5_9ROSI|nr:hypothetical protein SLEP1_g3373 [Rubroshorea leprosula]
MLSSVVFFSCHRENTCLFGIQFGEVSTFSSANFNMWQMLPFVFLGW